MNGSGTNESLPHEPEESNMLLEDAEKILVQLLDHYNVSEDNNIKVFEAPPIFELVCVLRTLSEAHAMQQNHFYRIYEI